MLTLDDYQTAIEIQDACNLSGVAIQFAKVITRIPTNSTSSKNQHTLCKLYIYKMFLLAFPDQTPDGFTKPYLKAMEILDTQTLPDEESTQCKQ